jgi:CheY-like chemotaxis protein
MFFFRKKKTVAAEFVPVVLPDPVQPVDPNAPRKKVLVVDDDAVIAKTLSLTLSAKGYQVLCAADSAQAIKLMREEDPDIMIVDVGLPPDIAMGGANLADGFQVTRWLQRANTRKIPSIIISGSNKATYKHQAAAVGADVFLTKPIDNQLLLDSIKCALAHEAPVAEGFETLKMASSFSVD